jgi:hypothetical protein
MAFSAKKAIFMQPLLDLLDSHASCVAIDLTNPSWHLNRNIGAVPG